MGQWKEWGIAVNAISATDFKLQLAFATKGAKGRSAGEEGGAGGPRASQADFWRTCGYNEFFVFL